MSSIRLNSLEEVHQAIQILQKQQELDQASKDLLKYCQLQYAQYKTPRHIRYLAEKLQRVESGACKRLLISFPPRHGKSQLTSEFFPAWYLGRHPDKYVIFATYAQELADDFGRKVRNQIRDEELYQKIFPGVALSGDSQSARRFMLTQGGTYFAVGAGGPITGRGAHCFPWNTQVSTPCGTRPIGTLQPGDVVLAYDTSRGNVVRSHVKAVAVRPQSGLYRITTSSGRVVEATGNHPFYVDGRWIEARSLASGDRLLCAVQQERDKECFRRKQVREEGSHSFLLLRGLLERLHKQCQTWSEKLPWVWRSCSKKVGSKTETDRRGFLLRQVLSAIQSKKGWAEGCAPALSAEVRDVQHGFYYRLVKKTKRFFTVLFPFVQGCVAVTANGCRWKPEVEKRCSASPPVARSERVPHDASFDCEGRRSEMRGVFRVGTAFGSASHRQQSDKQFSVKSCDSLLFMPSQMACSRDIEVEHDFVAVVERLCREEVVYDIQVAEQNNFFAECILVHNCLIVDDIIKGRDDADSTAIRRSVIDWYKSVAYTRLMPGGAIVIIGCMTGDTPVLMSDGAEKPIRDIKVGDTVATYRDGNLCTSTVLNWINHGKDNIFEIRMASGITVRANERHPFLVDIEGSPTWIRLKDLRRGHAVYRVNGEKQNTSDFILDRILEIVPAGTEDVFDIEVAETENFIANGLVSHNTRWHEEDLIGWVLANSPHEDWEVVNIPAIAEDDDALGREPGEALWPDSYPVERLLEIKATIGSRDWAALYQQSPTAEDGNIFKREWWKWWDKSEPPECDYVLQSFDTAFSVKTSADPTSIQTWGVFNRDDGPHLILLGRVNRRMEFPELRSVAKELYKDWNPDGVIIEKKASGQSLTQDLRRAGIPITEYSPDRDKVARAHAAAPLVESGRVWLPRKPWAEDFVNQLTSFPNGKNDDDVDAFTQAILRLKSGWFLQHPDDPDEDNNKPQMKRRGYW